LTHPGWTAIAWTSSSASTPSGMARSPRRTRMVRLTNRRRPTASRLAEPRPSLTRSSKSVRRSPSRRPPVRL
jgi:hypothetical protein